MRLESRKPLSFAISRHACGETKTLDDKPISVSRGLTVNAIIGSSAGLATTRDAPKLPQRASAAMQSLFKAALVSDQPRAGRCADFGRKALHTASSVSM